MEQPKPNKEVDFLAQVCPIDPKELAECESCQ
jgi:hypothetical protein